MRFSVDFPDRSLDRLTSFFRIFTVIPIAIVLAGVSGGSGARTVVASGGVIFLPPVVMLLFRRKYPRWWFEWNRELLRFSNRVVAYLALLDDRYPSTDEEQSVHLDFDYPEATRLNRWLPLVKWLLAIPHYIVLIFLYIGAVVAAVIAWFSVLFTTRYPHGLFDYVVGVLRWHNRVVGYAFVLVTDQYPPFSLSA